MLNTAHSPSVANSSASASWLPVCLPKFNSSGFVHAFVTSLQSQDEPVPASASESRSSPVGEPDEGGTTPTRTEPEPSEMTPSTQASPPNKSPPNASPGVGLIAVSGSGDFEPVKTWCDNVTQVCATADYRVGNPSSYGPTDTHTRRNSRCHY